MKRTHLGAVAGLLIAAGLVVACHDAATTGLRVSGATASVAQPGPPVLDQENGTLGFTGTDIRKGFNPHNPQTGDAIIATFIWQGSTNVITSVIDHLTDGTPVGNTYNLVEYKTAGGISMATYVALNVQNFPPGDPSNPNPDQNRILVVTATLSAPITQGGIMLSAYKGVALASALSGHASAGGTSSSQTSASTGPITAGDGALIYSVSFSSPNAAHDPPAGLNLIDNMSTGDGQVKIVGHWGVHSGSGTSDPTWTWYHTQPSSWLLTNIALLPNGGGPPPPTTGDLTVATSTSGSDLDPDGYNVTVDGSSSQVVGINGNVTFAGLSEGNHSVQLSDISGNCTVSGSNPRTVSVSAGATANATFTVSCTALPPDPGDLSVSASTSGADVDPNGYNVTVDGSVSQAVGNNGTVVFTGLAEGDYSVALSDVASNCSVSGSNPRTVSVPAGGTGSTTFSVTCTALPPPTGNLTVTASTSGSSLDPNGYTVTVDGGNAVTVATNGSVSYTGLSEGTHSVALSGVASNCTVSGANPRTLSVPAGGTASTTFSVTCVTPNQAPVANAGADETALVGVLYSLNWSFSDPDNGPWTFTIDWGDGTFSTGTKTSAGSFSTGHTYFSILPKTFTIRVTVRDSQGATHTDVKVVTVLLL